MNIDITFLLSLSCAFPLLVYLFINQRVDKIYHPLIFVFLLSLITEVFVYLNNRWIHLPGGMYYCYTLATLIWMWLYLRFFRNCGVMSSKRKALVIFLLYFLLVLGIWFWGYRKEGFFNFFRIGVAYATIVLFFYVDLFSRQVFSNKKNILKEPLLYFGLAGVTFHAFYIFTGTLTIMRISDGQFMNAVQNIFKIINVLTYIIFSIGLLWIQPAKSYIKSS